LFITIDKGRKRSYSNQIYENVRGKILQGGLTEGTMLPSTRELSNELAVSRNTVLAAYDMLAVDGFVQSQPGSGIYINRGVKATVLPQTLMDCKTSTLAGHWIPNDIISFDSGLPALDLFPKSKWLAVSSQAYREAPVSAWGYDDPQGRPELRYVLASYLKNSRGILCDPDQIIITSGAKQGLTLAAKCLINNHSRVWIEDPSNRNVYEIFSYHTDKITPIPVDREGILTNRFAADEKPDMIFITPSHQFPMGGILPIQRRLELIRFVRESGCFLIEDDYDSEFRYSGAPVKSLQELDPEHVIYIGTFSKILFPSLRLGYLVLPPALVPRFREWKRLGDHHSNSISQLALLRFIENGNLQRHVKRMKRIYKERRDTLLELLPQYFTDRFEVYGASAGMHVVLEIKEHDFTPDVIKKIGELGVYVVPVENHSIQKGNHLNQVILGYAQLSRQEMEAGLSIIKDVLTNSAFSFGK